MGSTSSGGGSGRYRAVRLAGLATAAVLAAVLAVVAVVAVAVVRPWEVAPVAVSIPPPAPEPVPSPVLAGAVGEAPAPDAGQVRDAVDDLVTGSGLGDRVSAAVVDVATGERRYGADPDRPVVPASTIKLVTAATVLAARGPAYQVPTTAVAGDEPGEVVLVGGGDPTLALDETSFYPGAARLDLLATQVRTALGDTPVTSVTVDSTRFEGDVYGPWDADIPTGGFAGPITALMADGGRVDPDPAQGRGGSARWDEPDLAVGEAFAEQLGLAEDPQVRRGEAPAGATVLGEVASPPVLRLVDIMLTSSDNVVAEMLARQVALARGEPASFQGAGRAMVTVLEELGIDPGDAVVADGSGLSRDNRVSAGLLTDLLALAADPASDPTVDPAMDPTVDPAAAAPEGAPGLAGLFAGLPVAGWSGTLDERYETAESPVASGAGVVRAKTGSLTGVDALAGVVVTSEGRLLAFAVLANDVPLGHSAAREALDRIPAALAAL